MQLNTLYQPWTSNGQTGNQSSQVSTTNKKSGIDFIFSYCTSTFCLDMSCNNVEYLPILGSHSSLVVNLWERSKIFEFKDHMTPYPGLV